MPLDAQGPGPEMVIVAYRAKPGCLDALIALSRRHHPRLAALGLVTARAPMLMTGAGGVVVEVFEWVAGGSARAHGLAEVHELWAEYAALCDYVPLAALPEAADLFATFRPL